jgi:hypothetical protein
MPSGAWTWHGSSPIVHGRVRACHHQRNRPNKNPPLPTLRGKFRLSGSGAHTTGPCAGAAATGSDHRRIEYVIPTTGPFRLPALVLAAHDIANLSHERVVSSGCLSAGLAGGRTSQVHCIGYRANNGPLGACAPPPKVACAADSNGAIARSEVGRLPVAIESPPETSTSGGQFVSSARRSRPVHHESVRLRAATPARSRVGDSRHSTRLGRHGNTGGTLKRLEP